MQERDSFNSQFGLTIAVIASAVGLGNIWRFPYLVGENGGAAFILIYLIFILLIGIPLVVAEITVGRRIKQNAVATFRKLGADSFLSKAGYLQVIVSFTILSFYCVVGGWAIFYFYKSITFSLNNLSSTELQELFVNFAGSPVDPIVSVLIFMLITALIVLGGIKNGIEKSSKILMPVFFGLIVVLMIRTLTLEGAYEGIEFLIKPDFSKIDSSVILIALGQTLFSLSIGCGILTYGSYMRKQDNIIKSTKWVVFSDTMIALFAVLAIIPAVFVFGFEPTEGPGLVFIVLPEIFAQIVGGSFLQILFFFSLIIAAVTSAICMLETMVTYAIEEWKISRKTATIFSAVITTTIGCFCSLSFNENSSFIFFDKTLFDIMSDGSSNILLPLSAAAVALLIGWKMKKVDVIDEISNSGTIKNHIISFCLFLLKYVVPFAMLIVLLSGLLF